MPSFLEPLTRRRVAIAVLVGALLRVVWVVWVTKAPLSGYTDNAYYLRMSEEFANRGTPTIAGRHTAFYPPGFSAVLSPVTWLGGKTGWYEPSTGAAMLNLVASIVSVGAVAIIADRWFGNRAAVVAAWLMAVAPAQIYFTSAALSETLFLALFLAGIVVASSLTAPLDTRSNLPSLVMIGVLAGVAALVRSPGVLLIFAPLLVVRSAGWALSGAVRSTAIVGVVMVVVLAPWAVRNVVQVGVLTPFSTNNAAAMCAGHRDGSNGTEEATLEARADCYTNSPFDDESYFGDVAPEGTVFHGPDEANWYTSTIREAVGWAITHPVEEVELVARKTWLTMGSSDDALNAAEDFGARQIGSDDGNRLLRRAADYWHWTVLITAGLAVLVSPRVRRTSIVWAPALGLLVMVWMGIGLSRYSHPVMPLLALLAAPVIGSGWAGIRSDPALLTADDEARGDSIRTEPTS